MTGTSDVASWVREVYEPHGAAILAYLARRIGRDDAEDLMMETFTVAWRRRSDAPGNAGIRPWLFVIARNLLANELRKAESRADRVRHLGVVTQDVVAAPEPSQAELVKAALARLSETDRELLLLACWDELSRDEIAAVLGVGGSTVSVRLFRARRRFAHHAQSLGIEVKSLDTSAHVGVGTDIDKELK